MRRLTSGLVLLLACLTLPLAARAEIVIGGTGTNLPPDPYGLSQYEGRFGAFVGTPIASQYFLTASHIGNAGNGIFTYNNGTGTTTTYHVVKVGSDPVNTDVALWKITDGQKFTDYAPVYNGTDASLLNQNLVSFGDGTTRGAAVVGSTGQTQGWRWGSSFTDRSWGTNTVDGIVTSAQLGNPSGFGGTFLSFSFDNLNNPNEAIYSSNDSGGGTFVYNPMAHQYQLAGINSLVDDVYDKNGNFVAAFNAQGLYLKDANGNLVQYNGPPASASSYATQVNSSLSILRAVPEPASLVLLALGAAPIVVRRRTRGQGPQSA